MKSTRQRRRRVKLLPINSLIPNILTVLALCAGMTSIRLALQEKWELAVLAILAAAILDGLDGRMARLLKGATKFGAELDSLSDFIAFGVAPAIMIYLWSTQALEGVGWIAGLAYATCCALRLARFNTALEDPDRPAWSANYFTGVAAPAGAGIVLLPMAVTFNFGGEVLRTPAFMAIWLLVVAFLMISRIPTYSFKRIRVRREYVLPTLVIVGLLAAVLFSYPWFFLTTAGFGYLASFPFSYRKYHELERAREGNDAAQDSDDEDEPDKVSN
jgi:CDP-diacylglycerol--serine O-phosphatidyltransferase